MAKKPSERSPMGYALHYLTVKDRTVREMRTYLDGKDFGEADVDATIQRLLENGLLDDARYAKAFVETRLNTKPISRAHLYRQMLEHGLSKTDIEAALETVDGETEAQNAATVAAKYVRQYRIRGEENLRERVLTRLVSRGFSYEAARRGLETALLEEDA